MALTRPRYSQIPDSDYKNSCRIVTTTNVTLTGSAPLTYDGVTLIQYDRVLVAGQTDKTQNGIYSVSTLGSGSNGTWVRSKDANANDRLTAGMNTFVEEGTYTGQFWHLLTPGPIVLGVTELVFGQITGNAAGISSQVQYNLNGSIAGAANLRYDSTTGNVLIGGGTASNSNVTGALVVRGGVGVSGNINVGANVSADKFYTTNGLFWAGNGLAFSSGLEVSEINTANTLSNISTQVTSLRFDKDTGFTVTELNPGNIKVSLGSSFKTWHVPGQADLVAVAEDEVTFFGNGIDITTNPTFPKSITFIANNSVLEANISAYQLYANANAAAQAVSIDTINSNVSAANAAIQSLSANIGTLVGGASAALDTLLELGNALGNSDSFSSTVVNWLSNISANVTAANAAITTLDANVGAFELYANANIGSIYNQLNLLDANVGSYQLYANANIGSIYNQLNTLDANVGNFESYANIYLGTATTFAVTNAGAGAYVINGESNPSLYLIRGQRYNFSLDASGHPFWIKTAASTGTGDQYNTGVTNNGDDVGLITFEVPLTAPDVLYYICQYHSMMAGQLRIVNFANIDANIGTLFLGNASTNANLGAFQLYANANIGSIYNQLNTLDANVGAFELYANANIGSIYNQLNTLDANVGAFELYANANIGTLFLGNASINANLGAYQLYANANAASQQTDIDTINANLGAYQLYANANIGTLFLGNASTNANLGAYQTWANSQISGALSEISALDTATFANAATQAVAINALSANINAFQSYANTKIGTNNNSNLVVTSTTDSVSAITGAVVVAGGMGIGGNLYVAGNIYASNLTAISISTLSVTDPLLYLTADTPFPYNYDIGFFSHYSTTSGFEQHTGIARDYTNGIWGFFSNLSANPGATVDWTEANLIYDTVRVGELVASNVTPSTSTTTGALRVAGGAGIAGELYINNTGDVSANIGSIRTQLNVLDANVGSYQAYANVYLGASTTFVITNSGSSEYVINGESNPALYLIRGQRYNFSVNAAGHPFWIKTIASIGVGDQYNTGVINNGEDVGIVVFEVPLTAPDVLYYISQFDAAMTNELRIVNFANLDANIGTLFLGNASTNANLGEFQTYANASFATLDANIGTLFLGNASTQANLGAFQTYANATFTTYSNANVTAYLPTHTGNISAGNIDVTGKAAVGTVYTTNGIYWSGNGNPYATGGGGGGGITYTASTTPPVGPAIGDQWYDTAEGILYEYIDDGDTDQWVDIVSPTFSGASPVAFNSNITVAGNILIGDGIYWSANGDPYASGGGSFSGEDTVLRANVGAYQIYANANIGTLFLGNISTQANLGTLYLGNISTQANLGAYQIWANSNFGTSTYSNTNVASYLTQGANIGSGTTTANLVAAATTTSTSTTTGALVVRGGMGVAGAAYIGGAVNITSSNNSSTKTTGALIVTGGIGAGGSINVNAGSTTQGWTVGGLLQTTASTPATSSAGGAFYSAGGAGIVGNLYVDGNVILASSTGSNVVVAGTTTSTSTSTGALVVRGGAGVAGDLNVGGSVRVTGSVSDVGGSVRVTGNVSVVGAMSGGVGYLVERANIVVAQAPPITNLDLLTAPVLYWTGNCNANITANIRGNATTTLNSVLGVGQTATFALFLPNEAFGYYANVVKIDNVTVTPVWLGGNTIVGGHADSIDVYTFTIVKTASATYKVFATQAQFQHTG